MTTETLPKVAIEPKIYKMYRDGMGNAIAAVRSSRDGIAPLPHVACHSPCGFEWGYGGSGPSDLALSLLADHLGEKPSESEIRGGRFRAWDLHQDFKEAIVAKIPKDQEWTLSSQEIDSWLAANDPHYGKTWRDVDREMWQSMDEVHAPDDPVELPEGTLGEKTELVYVTVGSNDTFAIVSAFDAEHGLIAPDCALYTLVFEAPAINGDKGRISIYRYYQPEGYFDQGHLRLTIVVAANLFPRWRAIERLGSTLRNIVVGNHSVDEERDESL